MRKLLFRHQAPASLAAAVKAGLGGMAGIALLSLLASVTGIPWLVAPLGASCVLLFAAPLVPFSQPVNLVAGHLLCSVIGLVVAAVAPTEAWSLGLAVGLSIAAMHFLRITHPPAGADPIVILMLRPGWDFLVFPMLAGCLVLLALTLALRVLPPRSVYPAPLPKGIDAV